MFKYFEVSTFLPHEAINIQRVLSQIDSIFRGRDEVPGKISESRLEVAYSFNPILDNLSSRPARAA